MTLRHPALNTYSSLGLERKTTLRHQVGYRSCDKVLSIQWFTSESAAKTTYKPRFIYIYIYLFLNTIFSSLKKMTIFPVQILSQGLTEWPKPEVYGFQTLPPPHTNNNNKTLERRKRKKEKKSEAKQQTGNGPCNEFIYI